MSAYPELQIENTNTPLEVVERLTELEKTTPREIMGFGCATDGLPEDAVNFCLFKENFDADLLPGLAVKKVTAAALASEDGFFDFLAPFLPTHRLLDHAQLCFNGQLVPIILLRELPAVGTQIIDGDGTWGWHAEIDGMDLVVKNAKTTAFGGGSDTDDSGQTASGFPTKGHPDLLGCALPFAYTGSKPRLIEALGGSPIPLMPYGIHSDGRIKEEGAHVVVSDPASGLSIQVPVVDRGPAKNAADPRPLDLTVAAARYFDSSATANNFSMVLDYRILNGVRLGGITPIMGIRDGFVREVVRIAMEEYNQYSKTKEHESPLSQRIRKYWGDLGFTFKNTGVPWSAVFISWVVKQAGANSEEFKFSPAHANFVYWAIKRPGLKNPAFVGRRINAYAPKVGDIIHNNRSDNSHDFDYAASHWQYESHSAIVVEVGSDTRGRYAMVVGGNESDSVRKTRVALKSDGKISQRNNDPYIAVLENIKA